MVPSNSTRSLKRQKQIRDARDALIYHVVVGLVGLVMLYPIIWMFSSSLKANDEIWTNVNSLIPKELHLDNYTTGWAGFGESVVRAQSAEC